MDKYLETLKECSKVAKEEFKVVRKKLGNLRKDLLESQQTLVETKLNLDQSDINDVSVYEIINEVNKKTSELLEIGFDDFYKSFQKKSDHLKDFTITLFGRTKAGKSTIREALTHGDGSSIGKGAQRTTRDVKEYRWNHLRILDTPGFDAYKGEEDTEIAFSQIDETDIILFLVTDDNIEESEFEKLESLRRENKPVIILLNILYDLKHPVKRKKFLQNPANYVSNEAIQGHQSRLQFLSKKHFDINNIPVIPIHALSAFHSTQVLGDESDDLYNASNFKFLTEFITEEIKKSGKQKRILSFRDSYIFHLENSIKPVYEESLNSLKPLVKLLKNKQFELKRWFDKFIPDKNDEIEREVQKMFDPVFEQIDSFVDENIEKEDFGMIWSEEVNKEISFDKLKVIQEKIVDDMNSYLDEFFREFQYDINLNSPTVSEEKLMTYKKSKIGKIARWSGAGIGIASSFILSTAVANSWNPLGLGLAAVGIGIGVFTLVIGDDTKRFNREKSKTKKSISKNLEKIRSKYSSTLKEWFYKDITKGLKKKITSDLYFQVELFQKLLNEYSQIIEKIESATERENIEIIQRLIKSQNPKWVGGIFKATRQQGVFTKLLVEKKLFKSEEEAENFTKIYGEQIIEVIAGLDRINQLHEALNSSKEELSQVTYDSKENKFFVRVKKHSADKIFGKNRINIKTAEQLIKYKIEVEVE